MSTYATSTVKLYYTANNDRWELLPNKLFIVESIEDYLATKTAKTITLFQYVKHELETGITVDLSQTYAEPLSASYKYVSITNSDTTKTYYYFVKNVIWRSKSSVRFELVMDVLNTFKEGTDYNFKANTRIIREHKNRFVIDESKTILTLHYYLDGYEGSLNTDDEVNVKEDDTTLFSGVIVSADQYTMTLEVSLPKEEIEALLYQDQSLTVKKNEYNYYDISLDSADYDFNLYRKIDYVSEGITPILQCGSAEGNLIENTKTLLNTDWYLLYRNQSDPSDSLVNPVECYLIPKDSKNVIASVITGGKITASSLQETYYYYMDISTETITLDNGTDISKNAIYFTMVILKKNADNTINVLAVDGNPSSVISNDVLLIRGEWNCRYITIDTMPMTYRYTTTRPLGTFYDIAQIKNSGTEAQFTNTTNIENINGINDLDRTQAKNIKLIKLPYCPYNFTITSSKIDISNDNNWDCVILGDLMVLKLTDLNTQLNNELNASSLNYQPLRRLSFGLKSVRDPQLTDLRKENDPKLLHSDFFRPTYVYDSFSYIIQMEKLDLDYYISNGVQSFYIDFDMTKTINSRFMFTFKNIVFNLAVESYANFMPIARNNEEVLYNVPYINYIRNGFNYDVKAKQINNASAWAGVGLSMLSVGASLFAPSVPLKVAGVVASLVSLAMTTKNAITSTIQNEENLQRKLTEVKNQTSSVAGSDDVDLMSIYASNRLKYLIYEPTPIMKNMLNDLFFYAGYYSNRIGLPNHNTRVNFDYLEADVVIEKTDNIPNDCLEELINSFKNGVSYIHKTARASNKWDLAQQYENWEKSLF